MPLSWNFPCIAAVQRGNYITCPRSALCSRHPILLAPSPFNAAPSLSSLLYYLAADACVPCTFCRNMPSDDCSSILTLQPNLNQGLPNSIPTQGPPRCQNILWYLANKQCSNRKSGLLAEPVIWLDVKYIIDLSSERVSYHMVSCYTLCKL